MERLKDKWSEERKSKWTSIHWCSRWVWLYVWPNLRKKDLLSSS